MPAHPHHHHDESPCEALREQIGSLQQQVADQAQRCEAVVAKLAEVVREQQQLARAVQAGLQAQDAETKAAVQKVMQALEAMKNNHQS